MTLFDVLDLLVFVIGAVAVVISRKGNWRRRDATPGPEKFPGETQ